MKAVKLTGYGDPLTNIILVDTPEPQRPFSGEALVEMEYAPVNPADLYLIMGFYAVKPPIGSVVGNEGVGKVIAVGPGVESVEVGDRVALPLSSFTWRERMTIAADQLVVLPSSADPKQLSMIVVNPMTAHLLLNEFVTLKAGDAIIQNAANSGVGRWVIAFARERGIKTINIVRRPELIADLKGAGATEVLIEGSDIAEQIKSSIGTAKLNVAFDGVSGPASSVLTSALNLGGTIVTYAAMSGQSIMINPVDSVFKDVTSRGLFIGNEKHASKYPAVIHEAARLVDCGKSNIPFAGVYPLSAISTAITHAQKGSKVLLEIKVR